MRDVVSIVKVNMAARPEVLNIISLLQKIETSFQAEMGYLASARPRPTAGDTIVCQISKIADNNRKWWLVGNSYFF